MLNNLTATVLFVQDVKKCRAFYEDIFGWNVLFEDDHSAAYRLEGGHDFVLLHTSAAAEQIGEENLTFDHGLGHRMMLCLGVDNVDETCDDLVAKGVKLLKPPKSQHWGRRTAYFADPEGNIWELWHYLPDPEAE